jgi:hypothetical protein
MPAFILWMDHADPSYTRFIFTVKNRFLNLQGSSVHDERIQKGKTRIKQEKDLASKCFQAIFPGSISNVPDHLFKSDHFLTTQIVHGKHYQQAVQSAMAAQASQICEPAKSQVHIIRTKITHTMVYADNTIQMNSYFKDPN